MAANLVGSNKRGKDGLIGYMRRLAVRNEPVFDGLLRHVMGSQVTIEHTQRPKKYQSLEEVVEELRPDPARVRAQRSAAAISAALEQSQIGEALQRPLPPSGIFCAARCARS